MRTILSRSNAEIQCVFGLQKAKNRAAEQCFIAEGVRACTTLLKNGIELVAFYATEALIDTAHEIIDEHLSAHDTTLSKQIATDVIVLVNQPIMEKISTAKTPSGLLGVFRIPSQQPPEKLSAGLVLVDISDGGNMGTLIRSATAVNAPSIVIVGGIDPWNPKVVQASAGTIGAIPLFCWTWQELIAHKRHLQLYALVVSGGSPLEIITPHNALLVIGSEAHGLSDAHLQDCDHSITLTMPGNTESMNAAAAGSIALYITFAQR